MNQVMQIQTKLKYKKFVLSCRGKFGVHHIVVNCWIRLLEPPVVTQQNHCTPCQVWWRVDRPPPVCQEEGSPDGDSNSCWEWVGQAESVDKLWRKKLENWQSYQNSEKLQTCEEVAYANAMFSGHHWML